MTLNNVFPCLGLSFPLCEVGGRYEPGDMESLSSDFPGIGRRQSCWGSLFRSGKPHGLLAVTGKLNERCLGAGDSC